MWNRELFRNVRIRKNGILKEIRELDRLNYENMISNIEKNHLIEMKNALEEVLIKEDRCWRQNVKIKCAKDGDANIRVFHMVVNGWRKRSVIKEIGLKNGSYRK